MEMICIAGVSKKVHMGSNFSKNGITEEIWIYWELVCKMYPMDLGRKFTGYVLTAENSLRVLLAIERFVNRVAVTAIVKGHPFRSN